MKDYWELKKIFLFSKIVSKFYNDTDDIVIETDITGKKYTVQPNSIINLSNNKPEDEYIIPNHDILNYSNRQIYKSNDFNKNLYEIILRFTASLNRGQIVEGVKFLEYHYKHSKDRKGLLRFVKYYIIPKTWMTDEFRKQYMINDEEINNWIKKKENIRKRRLYFIILFSLIILIFIIGFFFCLDKKIIVGAILGALLTQIGKLVDKIVPE